MESSGKQYRVSPGETIEVDRLGEEGTIELDRVLLVADGEKVLVGRPTIKGAKVVATVGEEVKGPKVVVFRYKSKVRYRKKTGHRQKYTRLTIEKIVLE